MTLLDENKHVFIVRIWLETRTLKNAPREWRGVVEHVTEEKRSYFKNLEDLLKYIEAYFHTLAKNGREGDPPRREVGSEE